MTAYGPYKNIASILEKLKGFAHKYKKEIGLNALDAMLAYFLCHIRILRG